MESTETPAPPPWFVHYMCLKIDPAWRRMAYTTREDGRESFARMVEEAEPAISTWAYSTVGLKTGSDLLLWRRGTDPVAMQDMTARLLQSGFGSHCEIAV